MQATDTTLVCRSCGSRGHGQYCSHCGQAYATKRITLHGLLHDVFHLFTHLDKGFALTLKQLTVAPGLMQRSYIEGDRARHQKPFSMFFICATLAALARYWIYKTLITYYGTDNTLEATFFHEYMVLMQVALLPLYALITYLIFRRSGYNYAEIGVLLMYSVSFFFLLSIPISLFKFIWPDLDTAYIELPLLMVYNTFTLIHFFNREARWKVVLKSLLMIVIVFLLTQVVEDWVIGLID